MTTDLPDTLRPFDDDLRAALSAFAPPADLDQQINANLQRATRLRLGATVLRSAAAAAAVGLVMTAGYVADGIVNPDRTPNALIVPILGHLNTDATEESFIREPEIEVPTVRPSAAIPDGGTLLLGGTVLGDDDSQSRASGPSNEVDGDLSEGEERDRAGPARYRAGKEEASTPTERRDGRRDTNLDATSPSFSLTEASKTPDTGLSVTPGVRGVFEGVPADNISTFDQTRTRNGESDSTLLPATGGGGGGNGRVSHGAMLGGSFRPTELAQASPHGEEEGEGKITTENASKSGESDAPVRSQPSQPAPEPAPRPVVEQPAIQRKVIRSGTVEFEVDAFDSALMTITRLVHEDGGFVASTDSAKLPNGKMRGQITVRIPPDRLDVLLLKLRGLGDLKSQQIASQDITKNYTDTESALRAARAMEERLLDMIKKGQGSIKDLLAAEKELGVWREKIEKLEGEKRYFDNLIGLSTLTITLQERDIKASAGAIETETVSAGVETDDVEQARAALLKAIADAKGRVITSDLKKLDAGQFAATIVAEVQPDQSGPIVDRLRQLGKVARLDVDRKQTTVDGSGPPVPGAQVEQKPTTLSISLYNLANVAPRLTATMTVASEDVETRYRSIIAIVEKAGGRVVTSSLQRPQPGQVMAQLQIEVPSAQAAGAEAQFASLGETMNLQLAENPDTANVTTAKQGFLIRLVSASAVPARESVSVQLGARSVADAHQALLAAAQQAGARVLSSNVVQGDRDNQSASLQLELPREKLSAWQQALGAAGDVLTRTAVRSNDTQNTLDSKLRIDLSLFDAQRLPPRQTTTATLHVDGAEPAQASFLALAQQLNGRVIDQSVSRNANGRSSARVIIDIPRDQSAQAIQALRDAGELIAMNTSTNSSAPDGVLSRTRIDLTLAEGDALVGRDEGLWASLRDGLSTSLTGLGWSLRLIVIGLCLIAPWALGLWITWKIVQRVRARRAVTPTA